jgi:predicted MFS family arabinose efflux permease
VTASLKNRKPQIWILCLLISFPAVGGVLFTPALPDLARFFGLSSAAARFPVSTYLLGYAVGQLLYGPLANRFGRRQALAQGIALAVCGTLICLLAAPTQSFSLLLGAISITALGACVGLVMTYTMIGDLYEGPEARRLISMVMASFSIMPGLGIAVGGVLADGFGWRGCFSFIAAYSAFLLLVSRLLPETARELDPQALRWGRIRRAYGAALRDRRLVGYAMIMGLATASFYVYAAIAPFVGQRLLNLTPTQYGLWNLITSIGFLIGFFLSARLSRSLDSGRIMLSGLLWTVVCGGLMLFFFVRGDVTVWTLFVPMSGTFMGMAVAVPSASVCATEGLTDKAAGSAVMSFLYIGVAVVVALIMGFIQSKSALQLPAAMLAMEILMLSILALMTYLGTKEIRPDL